MLVTTHVFAGAVVGALSPDPVAALTRGFASHFALDLVPHWGCPPEHLMRYAVPDGLAGLAGIALVARLAAPQDRVRVLAGVFGSCLPDIDKPAVQFFGRSPFPAWFDRLHQVVQHERADRWRRELVVAAASALATTGLLVIRRRDGSG